MESMYNQPKSIFVSGKIVAICEAILNEEIGVIAGSRILTRLELELSDSLGKQSDHDEDFLVFAAIDSETDHLPVDWERSNWSAEALERKDKEISESQAAYKESAVVACRILIERFDMKNGRENAGRIR